MKQKINELLNSSITSSYDSSLTEEDIFNLVGITKEQYYSALAILPDSNYELLTAVLLTTISLLV